MRCLLVAINSKYIHSNPAVYLLRECALRDLKQKQIFGVEVELAEYTINHHASEIFDDIYLHHADLVCFSCYIWDIEYVRQLVRNLKNLCPNVKIWVGGPEVSYDCESFLCSLPQVDGILYGEGEKSFPTLIEYYAARERDTNPPSETFPDGAAWLDENGVFHQTSPQPLTPMEDLPFIYDEAGRMDGFKNRIIYYETSRGCPFSCSYCLSSIDKKLRFRPLDTVKKELAFFLEQRVPQVKFVDRTFNCKKSHAMAIWQFICDHDNGVTNFHFEIAADVLDEEEIALLKTMRPGLVQLEIGVQTANPDTIRAINRKMDLARVAQVTKIIRQAHNIHQHLDLIAGLPLEDYESFGHSFDVVYKMKPSQLQLGFLKVLKGSPMQAQASQYGILSQAEPPYEVLKTPWLSYDDIIRLKGLEEMVETYYNSGQFSNTVKVLCKQFDRPFLLYEALSDEYRARKMHEKKHSREAQYQFIRDFAAARTTLDDILVRQVLTLDYYLRDYARKRPSFALEQDSYKEEIRAVCLKAFPESSYKDVIRDYHIEVFVPPFTEEKQFVLFDYQNAIRLIRMQRFVKFRNPDLLLLYYDIGTVINKYKTWGNKFIDNLSYDIQIAFSERKGYSVRNLKYMAKFATRFSDRKIVQEVLAQITWYKRITSS